MGDILAFIIQCIVEWFWDLFLQLIFQSIAELLAHMLKGNTHTKGVYDYGPAFSIPPILRYAAVGAMTGAISLWIVPNAFLHTESMRLLNVFFTPFIVGVIMSQIGAYRTKKGQEIVKLDTFKYAYVFGLCLALVRFGWAQ